jgi:type I restriction enzyme, S subunit
MKQKGKRTLTPKLRFPEFRGGEGWQTPQLSDLYGFKRTNTLSRDKLNYEAGTIRNIHYGDIHTKFKPLFRVEHEDVPFINPEVSVNAFKEEDDCKEGDIVLADASEDLNDVGKAIEVISVDGQRVVAGTHTILATRHGNVPIVGFGGHLFQSASVRAGIQRESQGAKVYGISANRISPVALPLPPTDQEQQKIAECLGSLDGLIVAVGRKLAVLRDHKRGLMQQLFPQPGQTQPRLRFPEFRDKEAWEEKSIGEVFQFKQGVQVPVGNQYAKKDSDMVRFIRIVDLTQESEPLRYIVNPGDEHIIKSNELFMIRYGTPGIVAIGYEGVIANNLFRIIWKGKKEFIPKFWFYIFKNLEEYISNLSASSSMPAISFSTLSTLSVIFPTIPEQQMIADCLTALDERIAAQAAKIETLKQHKRGLMQQLFPMPEEHK